MHVVSLAAEMETDTHCGVFKVVQAAVCQDEPPPLPGFNSSPCGAEQPASEKISERKREKRAPKRRVEQQTGRQMYGQTDR